jgi:hypothetical protein
MHLRQPQQPVGRRERDLALPPLDERTVRLDLAEAVLGRSADYSAGHEQIAVAVDGHLVRYI